MNQCIVAVVGFAVWAVNGSANAEYLRLDVQLHSRVDISGQGFDVYRVYALFDDADDYLVSVAASPTIGNITLQSRNHDDSGPGSNFFNPPGGGITAPSAASIAQDPSLEWDTFVTIGVSIADQAPPPFDQTGVSPGFMGPASGNSFTTNNAGWFTSGLQEQGRAGFAGDGDLSLRVMLVQLTVNSGDNVRGTVAVFTGRDVPLAGAQLTLHSFQTFNSVPAPASGLLIALAGLMRWRQREA